MGRYRNAPGGADPSVSTALRKERVDSLMENAAQASTVTEKEKQMILTYRNKLNLPCTRTMETNAVAFYFFSISLANLKSTVYSVQQEWESIHSYTTE